jgi:ABC-type nitrate/sulfonate/bicarbonate transport system substrate-binding protein
VSRLRLTLACGGYDRTRALEEGVVRPDGIEITYLRLPVEETFFRMMRHHEFEVAELSLSSYVVSLQEPEPPFIALPVFPSRQFRHSSVYVNAEAGIVRPEDLRGRRVGTPEYQLTACVWVRGILADQHGVPVDSVTYVTGGQEELGRIEKAPLNLPGRFRVEAGRADRTLSQQLADGEVDALFTPRVPSPFAAGDPRVSRLFPDVVAAERDYFSQTKIFPIMHVVVIRRDIYRAYPWVAQSLTKAFGTAKAIGEEDLYDSSALRVMEPWLILHLEQARAALGPGFWSYGLDANRNTLATFLRYHHEQGLSSTLLRPEDLFAAESLESAAI